MPRGRRCDTSVWTEQGAAGSRKNEAALEAAGFCGAYDGRMSGTETLQAHFDERWFLVVFLFCGALVVANLLHWFVFRVLRRKEEKSVLRGWGIKRHLSRPARTIVLLSCGLIALPFVPRISESAEDTIRRALLIAMVVSLGWLAIGAVYVLQEFLLHKYDLSAANNLRARRIHTQIALFRRLLIGLIVIVTIGAVLWTFRDQRLWEYGTGLVASAGLASLVLATAAKSTASNVLAGLQIAVTEPIRIDDVVVVQGEWGRIEEITSAYVVVRIWDLRRLIVPLTWFIENSFQNWSRESTEVMGTSMLYVDYSTPVEPLRAELVRLVAANPLWNGKTCALQVTNLTEQAMELRCLVSADNAGALFDLRCQVREGMIAFVQQTFPEAFPRRRSAVVGVVELEDTAAEPPLAANDARP